jgi:hypothetical protein
MSALIDNHQVTVASEVSTTRRIVSLEDLAALLKGDLARWRGTTQREWGCPPPSAKLAAIDLGGADAQWEWANLVKRQALGRWREYLGVRNHERVGSEADAIPIPRDGRNLAAEVGTPSPHPAQRAAGFHSGSGSLSDLKGASSGRRDWARATASGIRQRSGWPGRRASRR